MVLLKPIVTLSLTDRLEGEYNMEVYSFRDEDPEPNGIDWEPIIGIVVAGIIFILALTGLVTVIRMVV